MYIEEVGRIFLRKLLSIYLIPLRHILVETALNVNVVLYSACS